VLIVGRSTASGASTMSGTTPGYSKIRSNRASDDRSSTETWSSYPIGKYRRVCSHERGLVEHRLDQQRRS
jgi:hypothetical protein